MARKVHVALARVYASASSYGTPSFAVPKGSPIELAVAGELLKVHFGQPPDWLTLAESRSAILGEAMLRAYFRDDLASIQNFNARMAQAKPSVLASPDHNWIVALVLQKSAEWPDEDDGSPWLWFRSQHLFPTLQGLEVRIPSLDLASRVLRQFLPNAMTEIVVRDHMYLARSGSFDDAIAISQPRTGRPTASTTTDLKSLEVSLAGPELGQALKNAISAPAIPQDAGRYGRFEAALEQDRLADEGGSYGRYELLREIQTHLMRASQKHPFVVLFVDMNGLKGINDHHGHAAGNKAIAEFRLAVRDVHLGNLFRLGGDEFALFALTSRTQASALGRDLLRSVALRSIHGNALSASVGIVLASDPTENPENILERADKEMYEAKKASKTRCPRPCAMAVQGLDVEIVD